MTRYTNTAIALHWLVALLVFAAFPLGMYMHDLPLSPTKLQLYSYHKWLGMSVLVLAVLRAVWRATHEPPALPDTMPRWQKVASAATHQFLYVLLFVIPLSGWLMSSAKGFKTVWLGVLPLPDLVGKDKALGDMLGSLHESFNYMLLALVVLHIAAALKHRFIDRDGVMERMWPGGARK
ncbi:MAG: cytochrome b [Gallionellaceae bacterium]|nr:MAG: cytochrome b [Gallionellaceae bacterium]